jgi:hypothetical protein
MDHEAGATVAAENGTRPEPSDAAAGELTSSEAVVADSLVCSVKCRSCSRTLLLTTTVCTHQAPKDPIDIDSDPDLLHFLNASRELFAADILSPVGTTRQFGRHDAVVFLELLRDTPHAATIAAYKDFKFTAKNTLPEPLIEREYWLKLSLAALAAAKQGLAGKDGYAIMHVHHDGVWDGRDLQAGFDRKRSTITQFNIRHTWDTGRPESEKFWEKCIDLDKWRESGGMPILDHVHTQQVLKFQWAAFGKRDGGSLVANVAAVMCEPALADRDLTNAHELKGRYTRSHTHTHTHTRACTWRRKLDQCARTRGQGGRREEGREKGLKSVCGQGAARAEGGREGAGDYQQHR